MPKRTLRILTHINIGATLGIAAWLVWFSAAVVFAPSIKSTGFAHPQPLQIQPVSTPACECSRSPPRLQVMVDEPLFTYNSESAGVNR